MNTRTAHGDTVLSQKRDQIIESAFHLFAKQGYHATAMRQIAWNAGVLPSNVYNYFDSKGAIYQSVLEQYHPWLAFHDDPIDRYASGVTVEAFEFLQFWLPNGYKILMACVCIWLSFWNSRDDTSRRYTTVCSE